MDFPSVPGMILGYIWIGGISTIVIMFAWCNRRSLPFVVHAVLFPVNTFRGRSLRALPPVDWVIDKWRLHPGGRLRYAIVALYILGSTACWPLRIFWPLGCMVVGATGVVFICVYAGAIIMHHVVWHHTQDLFYQLIPRIPLV